MPFKEITISGGAAERGVAHGAALTAEERQTTFDEMILPDPGAFQKWQLLIKEWVGYVVYAIRGWV